MPEKCRTITAGWCWSAIMFIAARGTTPGFPVCLELKTGKFAWEGGRGPGQGSAAVMEAEGNLYFRYQNGIVALIEANPKKYVLKGTFKTATKNGEGWPHPVIVDRQLFLRDQDELLCYDIAKKDSAKSTGTKRRADRNCSFRRDRCGRLKSSSHVAADAAKPIGKERVGVVIRLTRHIFRCTRRIYRCGQGGSPGEESWRSDDRCRGDRREFVRDQRGL